MFDAAEASGGGGGSGDGSAGRGSVVSEQHDPA